MARDAQCSLRIAHDSPVSVMCNNDNESVEDAHRAANRRENAMNKSQLKWQPPLVGCLKVDILYQVNGLLGWPHLTVVIIISIIIILYPDC